MPVGERILVYNTLENVLTLSFRGVHLTTVSELDQHFHDVLTSWRARCGGRKVYWLVDFHDFKVDIRESERYAFHMRRIFDESALAIVRFGGNELTHASVRLYSLRLHRSANLYSTREEALEVIRRIAAGELPHE